MAISPRKFEPARDGSFDPQWLIDAVTSGGRADHALAEKLRACTRYLGAAHLMVFFVSPENANQPGAAWQFDRMECIDHADFGAVHLSMLHDGRVGSIEFRDHIGPNKEKVRERAGARPQSDAEAALLQEALQVGYSDAGAFREFILNHPEIIDLSVAIDESLLHYLAIEAEIAAVRVLLECGANVNRRSRDGDAILNDVMWGCTAEMVRVLVEAGAAVNYQAPLYGTPLHLARPPDLAAKIDLLVNAGADIYAETKVWETPLHAMVINGYEEGVRALLRHGADPNHRAGDGSTAIQSLGRQTTLEVVEVLAAAGADLATCGEHCGTALHSAAFHGKEDVVRYLLLAGLDPHFRTARGENAMDKARRSGHPRIAELLENWRR